MQPNAPRKSLLARLRRIGAITDRSAQMEEFCAVWAPGRWWRVAGDPALREEIYRAMRMDAANPFTESQLKRVLHDNYERIVGPEGVEKLKLQLLTPFRE